MHEWGFNFARLPVDFRWLERGGYEELGRAIQLGKRYAIHIQICLHRIPGYCSGGLLPGEASLFEDTETLERAKAIWRKIATLFKEETNDAVSFNIFNEPLYMEEGNYTPVAEALVNVIRECDTKRFIIVDGLGYGRIAPSSLGKLPNLGFGWHCYDPFNVTHYFTPWNDPSGVSETPKWPLDENWLERETWFSKGWDAIASEGGFIYVGEFGTWRKTPHDVALSLMSDQLAFWQRLNLGWALWNFRGDFGILDSNREDVEYEDFRGHKLDRAMLSLLQRY